MLPNPPNLVIILTKPVKASNINFITSEFKVACASSFHACFNLFNLPLTLSAYLAFSSNAEPLAFALSAITCSTVAQFPIRAIKTLFCLLPATASVTYACAEEERLPHTECKSASTS